MKIRPLSDRVVVQPVEPEENAQDKNWRQGEDNEGELQEENREG